MTWNPHEQYVDNGAAVLETGKVVQAQYCAIGAGPPRLDMMGDASTPVRFVGKVQNWNINQAQQVQQLFEIGSNRSYMVAGRSSLSLSLSNMLIHGPNLLRCLYAYYPAQTISAVTDSLGGLDYDPDAFKTGNVDFHTVIEQPGYANFWANLHSDIFKMPIGLLIYLADTNLTTYGALYLENGLINSHGMSTSADGTLIMEQVSMTFERPVPVAMDVEASPEATVSTGPM